MSFDRWCALTRRLLADYSSPSDLSDDGDLRKYYDRGDSPQTATLDLVFVQALKL